jgi:aspartyl-tRNA synthetase
MSDPFGELFSRTIGAGRVGPQDADAGREVVLTGWVHRRRDLGRIVFLEIRDASGRVQAVVDPSDAPEAHAVAEKLRQEDVVGIAGRVALRESPNPAHPTGMVEVRASRIVLHNRAESMPFPLDDDAEANEEARLRFRYVDLRRPRLQHALRLRHRLSRTARAVLDEAGFVEIETPILTRSTPEGARDYLVPSRVHRGRFYALPQSPQLFKQLLMVAGFERYYQFARCFRDEDLRADRQPEFTQIDLEMSFAKPESIREVIEPLMVALFREIGVEVPAPFPRISYAEAMRRFGTDRPDARFGMEIREAGPAVRGTGFAPFEEALAAGGVVRGIAVPGGARATRKQIDAWTTEARAQGAGGLLWVRVDEGGVVTSSALKALGEEGCRRLHAEGGGGAGDATLWVSARTELAARVLGALRLSIAAAWKLVPDGRWDLLWVERFPLFDWDEREHRWVSCHHPFTAPLWEDLAELERDPGAVRAQAYDLVLNGTEIGGGSIRIHRRDVQDRVFRALGIPEEEADAKFGFLRRALDSGAPPHGGIALGFDRICAMLCRSESIRDVIAFPKTTSASCLMTEAPASVDERQMEELGLRESSGRDGPHP